MQILILFMIIPVVIFGQTGFDKALLSISHDLSTKLSQKGATSVVVLYITDINKAQTTTGKYMADVISVNIVNDQANIKIFDRENLAGIKEANQLIDEGYVSVDKAKELGKILSVDAIIIGNYTVLNTTIKLSLKALESSTGFVLSASIQDLPIDGDATSLLGISISGNNAGGASNKGFNRPIGSNEDYNNPETVDKNCEENSTGDFCFVNTTKDNFIVSLNADGVALQISAGETQCLYSLRSGSYNYHLMGTHDFGLGQSFIYRVSDRFTYVKNRGQILIEQCKSKSFTIK